MAQERVEMAEWPFAAFIGAFCLYGRFLKVNVWRTVPTVGSGQN